VFSYSQTAEPLVPDKPVEIRYTSLQGKPQQKIAKLKDAMEIKCKLIKNKLNGNINSQ
jgi:hypothetical protein